MNKLGIIGLGKMGNSILEGIISSGIYKKEELEEAAKIIEKVFKEFGLI